MSNLSFSQISKYSQCPRSYKFYYKDRLREKTVSSFLAFGSAIDTTLNAVLNDYKEHGKVSASYKLIFDSAWQEVEIHKVRHPLMECTLVGYAKSDFAPDLLTPQDRLLIQNKQAKLAEDIQNLDIIQLKAELEERKSRRAFVEFSEPEHKLLNFINWLCVRRKAHLMLDAYVADILTQIAEVKEIQHKIELTNDSGQTFIGYIDAIVRFKGDDYFSVLDNKTSASPYTQEKLDFSQQLASYAFACDLKHGAYAVMLKSIVLDKKKTCLQCGYFSLSAHKTCNNEIDGKRCGGKWDEVVSPQAKTQLIRGSLSESVQNTVMENINEVNQAIQANIFPRNLSACSNIFGNPCPYIKACWKNDKSNLIDLNHVDENS